MPRKPRQGGRGGVARRKQLASRLPAGFVLLGGHLSFLGGFGVWVFAKGKNWAGGLAVWRPESIRACGGGYQVRGTTGGGVEGAVAYKQATGGRLTHKKTPPEGGVFRQF